MRVLLCDDHMLLLDCLVTVFEGRGHQVDLVLDPAAAAAFLTEHEVDVCVVDLGFPKGDGNDPVTVIRKAAPVTLIVVFTATSDPTRLEQARESGADAYVSKESSLEALVSAVERARLGPAEGAAQAMWNIRPAAAASCPENRPHFLTPREKQALEGLVRGKNTTELAAWMGVRESTVSTHVQTVLAKLGVHSRLEAVAYAMTNRLVSADR